jgi:hypothetical protein
MMNQHNESAEAPQRFQCAKAIVGLGQQERVLN